MAKQSGIHQLRGKVGEMSYYKTTGIAAGLVRSINQGLSGRVKTGDEYANTRLNNAEFGQAGRIASILGRSVTPKFRPMILPFSQSRMAQLLLEYIKMDTAQWGKRNLTTANLVDACTAALNAVAKNSFSDLGLTLTINQSSDQLTIATTASTVNLLEAWGADGFFFRFINANPWIGIYSEIQGRYAASFTHNSVSGAQLDDPGEGDEQELEIVDVSDPPTGWPAIASQFCILVAMPYRTIAGVSHVLQEHCTFKAFAIEPGEVN